MLMARVEKDQCIYFAIGACLLFVAVIIYYLLMHAFTFACLFKELKEFRWEVTKQK